MTATAATRINPRLMRRTLRRSASASARRYATDGEEAGLGGVEVVAVVLGPALRHLEPATPVQLAHVRVHAGPGRGIDRQLTVDPQPVPVVAQPRLEAWPFTQQCFVRQLDGSVHRSRYAIEGEQARLAEAGQRRPGARQIAQLPRSHPAAGVLRALTERDQPGQHATGRSLLDLRTYAVEVLGAGRHRAAHAADLAVVVESQESVLTAIEELGQHRALEQRHRRAVPGRRPPARRPVLVPHERRFTRGRTDDGLLEFVVGQRWDRDRSRFEQRGQLRVAEDTLVEVGTERHANHAHGRRSRASPRPAPRRTGHDRQVRRACTAPRAGRSPGACRPPPRLPHPVPVGPRSNRLGRMRSGEHRGDGPLLRAGDRPARTAGSTPARTTDDLPQPDGPTTVMNPSVGGPPRRTVRILSTRRSRPKKSDASVSRKAQKPLVRIA